jgi:hypothetical protein
MNFNRIGFSLSPFVASEVKNHASPANMPARFNRKWFRRGRPVCGTGNAGAIKCSPEGERYNGHPGSKLIGGAR